MRDASDARQEVLSAAKEMFRRGLVEGSAGNISARLEDGTIVITPSSVDYSEMALADLVLIGPDGSTLEARDGRSPSSEYLLHLACYQAFEDIGSVVHSHPVHATMFAVTGQGIPACIDEFAIYVGGDVRCTRYAPSGTPEVGQAAVEALAGRKAAVIANHGLVSVAATPALALHITALVERGARIVWGAKAIGPIQPLPDMAREG